MSYCLALLSSIPLVRQTHGIQSLDLWVRDLQGQVGAVRQLVLFAPFVDTPPADWNETRALPLGIRVVDVNDLDAQTLRKELQACDVVQLPGNFTWRNSAVARRFLRAAGSLDKPVIVGISSDRAKTELLNATGATLWRRAGARWRSCSIRVSQSYLAWRAAGTFVVGEGLRRLVDRWSRNVLVGTASWIRSSDIRPARPERDASQPLRPLRLCAAARLEPMKGTHLAIQALARLMAGPRQEMLSLDIAGVGPEAASLRALASQQRVADAVRFVGGLSYPVPFLEWLADADIVVLTNLNEEQPRLVFDAISQGCLLVCPDSLAYRSLGVPDALLYRRGDVESLAASLARVMASSDRSRWRQQLAVIAANATIESMHAVRHDWVRSTVLRTPE